MLMETKMVSHRCLGALIISPTRELVSTVYITYHVQYIPQALFTVRRMLCIAWHTAKNVTAKLVTALLVEQ